MKYLLSTGRVTQNPIIYIKDIIIINMGLLKEEIPYFDGGTVKLIPDITGNRVEEKINSIISKILDRINLSFKDMELSIIETIIDNSLIRVKLNINGNIHIYDIKKSN